MMGLPMIAAIPTNVMTKPASIALRLCPRIISALAQNVNPHVPQKAAKPVSPSKPHVATYTKAAELLGLKPDQILFVANHAFDCIGAKSAGLRSAFIDTRSRPFGETPHQPDIISPR